MEVVPLGSGVVLLRFDLDFGLQPLIALVVLQNPGQSAVGRLVVHMRTGPQVGAVEKIAGAHSRVAGHLHGAHPRLGAGDDPEGNVHELFLGMRGQSGSDDRFMESVYGQGLTHLVERLCETGLDKTVARRQLAGALQLRIDIGALGSIHADRADEGAGCAVEDQGHAALERRCCHVDGFKKAGGKELPQAPFQVVALEGRSHQLGQTAGQRDQAVGRNSLDRDTAHRQSFELSQGVGGSGEVGLRCARVAGSAVGEGFLLAPANAAHAEGKSAGQQNAVPVPRAAPPCWLSSQNDISQKVRGKNTPMRSRNATMPEPGGPAPGV